MGDVGVAIVPDQRSRAKPTDQRHKDMVNLVQQRIDVEVDMLAPSSPGQQSIPANRATALDAQIETVVQHLFDLDASDVLLIDKELQGRIQP